MNKNCDQLRQAAADTTIPLADAPQTGMLQWPIPVLLALGVVLLGLGIRGGRKTKNEG